MDSKSSIKILANGIGLMLTLVLTSVTVYLWYTHPSFSNTYFRVVGLGFSIWVALFIPKTIIRLHSKYQNHRNESKITPTGKISFPND